MNPLTSERGALCLNTFLLSPRNQRIAELTGRLGERASYCETAQKHLDESSIEQACWHYGYLCALRDVVAAIEKRSAWNWQRGQVQCEPDGRRG